MPRRGIRASAFRSTPALRRRNPAAPVQIYVVGKSRDPKKHETSGIATELAFMFPSSLKSTSIVAELQDACMVLKCDASFSVERLFADNTYHLLCWLMLNRFVVLLADGSVILADDQLCLPGLTKEELMTLRNLPAKPVSKYAAGDRRIVHEVLTSCVFATPLRMLGPRTAGLPPLTRFGIAATEEPFKWLQQHIGGTEGIMAAEGSSGASYTIDGSALIQALQTNPNETIAEILEWTGGIGTGGTGTGGTGTGSSTQSAYDSLGDEAALWARPTRRNEAVILLYIPSTFPVQVIHRVHAILKKQVHDAEENGWLLNCFTTSNSCLRSCHHSSTTQMHIITSGDCDWTVVLPRSICDAPV